MKRDRPPRQTHEVSSFDGTSLYFETYGDPTHPALFLGPHFYATRGTGADPQPWIRALNQGRYLIVADYPRGVGRTPNPLGSAFTAGIAADEIERIADAAGAARFAWIGYSFGGALGVQVACRTKRVSALVIGGFPPLSAPFSALADALEELARTPPAAFQSNPARYLSSAAFYRSLEQWDERDNVDRLVMPRLVFMGSDDRAQGMSDHWDTSLSTLLAHEEPHLLRIGWDVEWLAGHDHGSAIRPDVVLSLVIDFLAKHRREEEE